MHRIFFRLGNSCIIHLSSHSIQLFGAIRGPNSSTWGSLTRPRQCDGDLRKSSLKGCQPPRGAWHPSGCFNQPAGLAGELASLTADPREGAQAAQACVLLPLGVSAGWWPRFEPPAGQRRGGFCRFPNVTLSSRHSLTSRLL